MEKNRKKRIAAVIAAAALGMLAAFPAWAATTKKITSISLDFSVNIQPGTDFGDETIEIESTGDKFSVNGYEVKNVGFGWEVDTVPKIEITLDANDNYRFTSSIARDRIRLKGDGATFKSGVRKDSGRQLVMTVELDSLAKSLSEIPSVSFSKEGVASWEPIMTAGSYELKVYRDGKAVGTAITTASTTYNCREKLTKAANYYVRVRPINKVDKEIKGTWTESATIYVDSDKATYFRTNPITNPEGGEFAEGGWKQAEDGRWWYDNGNGTFAQNKWQLVGDKWYFFDEAGYMQTGWIKWQGKEYYCGEDGAMLTNCWTPDDYWVGADGAMKELTPSSGEEEA